MLRNSVLHNFEITQMMYGLLAFLPPSNPAFVLMAEYFHHELRLIPLNLC